MRLPTIFITSAILATATAPEFLHAKALPPDAGYYTISWSPDGRRLAYTQDKDVPNNYQAHVYIVSANTGHSRQLTHWQPVEAYGRWSPNGRQIIFMSAKGGGQLPSSLFTVAVDEKGAARRASSSAIDAATPDISPDGKHVVFAQVVNGRRAIVVANMKGGETRILTAQPGFDLYNPIWSPDGKRIAFYSDAGNHLDQIWLMDSTGNNAVRVTDGTGQNIFPSWSPDGSKLIFSSESPIDKIYRLKVMALNDRRTVELPGTENAFMASWSSKHQIAFVKLIGSGAAKRGRQIVIMNEDGTRRVELQPA